MKLNERKVARLAACMAISNMGHQVPEHAAKNPKYWSTSISGEVCNLAGHLMETDEHQDIFEAEADMWAKTIRRDGAEKMMKTFDYDFVRDILTAELES